MSSKIRYCSECGKEISAQAVVCPNCGVQLKPLNFSSGKNKYVAAVLAFLLGGTVVLSWQNIVWSSFHFILLDRCACCYFSYPFCYSAYIK